METNKLFLETKIDISKVSLTTGPEMEGIKRMGADFYQFNSDDRESILPSTFSFSTRPLFALFVVRVGMDLSTWILSIRIYPDKST